MTETDTEEAVLRRKLIFRSWHRGTREMDLLLGRFAERAVPGMTAAELALYEEFLMTPDPDIYDWASGRVPVPESERGRITDMLLDYMNERSRQS